jgi:hypothetical protein
MVEATFLEEQMLLISKIWTRNRSGLVPTGFELA